MHEEAKHDAPVGRYDPPSDLKAYAHNRMLEKEDGVEKFARQQWEAALGALRVALGALREIYPSEAPILDSAEQRALASALGFVEDAHLNLDALEDRMLGVPMVEVLRGDIRSIAEYRERYEVKRLDRAEMHRRLDDQA